MSTNKSKIRLRNTSVVFLVGDIAATIRWYVGKLGFKATAFTATAAFSPLRRESIR